MNDYFGYKGKVCVVTGASSGMGEAAAKILTELGAQVYALNRRACAVPGVTSISADMADKKSIDAAFAKLPEKIDCFFGVAGLSGLLTDYMTTFNVNYTANMYICEQYLKERMPEGGAIVLVTSTAGVAWKENLDECAKVLDMHTWEDVQARMQEIIPEGTPAQMAYMYSKRLANAYGCRLAIELAAKKIRVNLLLPGSTDTGMKDQFAAMAGGLENMIKYAGCAGRLASSEEMGWPIVFLNSDMASFISGFEMIVDYCDNAMKKLGMKPEMCAGPAIIDAETLQKLLAQRK